MNQILSVSRKLNLPILISEWGLRQEIAGWSNTPGAKSLVKTQRERAQNYTSQILNIFKLPEFIGAHWFRWQDHIMGDHKFNKGIVMAQGSTLEEYQELTHSMTSIHTFINENIQSELIFHRQ